MNLSKPTIAQLVKTLELIVVTYGFSFFGFLIAEPGDLNWSTIVAANAAALAGVYRLVKSFLTDL